MIQCLLRAALVLLACVTLEGRSGADEERHTDPAHTFILAAGDREPVIVGQAAFLRDGIRRCTGAELTVVSERNYDPNRHGPAIFVGDTAKAHELLDDDMAGLDAEGYLILVLPDLVVIYAPPATTDTGDPLTWAQADFLRRFLGVDWYLPGPIGEEYPSRRRVEVPCGKWVENPAFKHRQWSGHAGKPSAGWRVRASGGGGRFRFHHNLHRIVDPARFADQPDLFPMLGGTRAIPTRSVAWQPCTTNPDLARITIRAIDDFLAANPLAGGFSLGVNDSKGYCQCPLCLAQTPPHVEPDSRAAHAHRFFEFYNQVARATRAKHPDARLGLLAYEDLNAYDGGRLEPALMPYLTLSMADCWDATYKAELMERMQHWSERASHWGVYEWLYGQGFLIPRLYLHELAEGLRIAHRHGADGFYAEAYPHWSLDGPKLWVLERLLWNPRQDVDALLDQWCRGMFRDAAAPMRAYFDLLERIWAEQKPADARRGGYRLWGVGQRSRQFGEVFPPARCEEAWRLLDAARAGTSDPTALARIAYFRAGFGATRLAATRAAAVDGLAAMATRKPEPSPEEWLVALDPLARVPTLGQYIADHRAEMPMGLQELASSGSEAEHLRALTAWDSRSPQFESLAVRLASAALKSCTTAPSDQATFDAVIDRVLDECASAARQHGPVDDAVRTLRDRLRGLSLVGADRATPPPIDGNVSEAWGRPSFDGSFSSYDQTGTAPQRTQVWTMRSGSRLLVAFQCEQPGAGIRAAALGHDDVQISPQGVVQPGNNGADFPYFHGADAVGVRLPDGRIAIVTAGGGVFDGEPSAQGYRTQWNGVTAAVARQPDGWSATLAIEDPGIGDGPGPTAGINFLRVVAGARSTWVPSPPRVWSIDPRSSGYLFFSRGPRD